MKRILLVAVLWISFWELVVRFEGVVYALADLLDERFDVEW